jgi:DNA-binding NarL/FixJ family response regulator
MASQGHIKLGSFKTAMAKALRLLIVDDQRRTRQSLRALLSTEFPLIKLLEAENGVEALNRAEDWLPDIVLLDVRMPDVDGIEVTRLMKRQRPEVKVIVLSISAEYYVASLEAGADAFMSKGEPPERLLAVLNEKVSQLETQEP